MPPREGAGAVGNPTCSKEARVLCSPLQLLQRKQQGLGKPSLVGKGLETFPAGKVGACPFPFLEISTKGGKGEKGILLHLSDTPSKPFWGAVLGEHCLSAAILQYEILTRRLYLKCEYLEGLQTSVFDSPYHLQSSPVHYYHSRAMGQITVLGGAFGKWLCFPLSPLWVGEVESSYTCHFIYCLVSGLKAAFMRKMARGLILCFLKWGFLFKSTKASSLNEGFWEVFTSHQRKKFYFLP